MPKALGGLFGFHADERNRDPNPTHLRGSTQFTFERPDNSLVVFAA
jgi:hypothetical protein